MSTPTATRRDSEEAPAPGRLREYIDDREFGDRMTDLERFTDRLAAAAEPHRYALLQYVYTLADGEIEVPVERAMLLEASELSDTDGGFTNHMKPLLRSNLLAEAPAPADEDGRKKYYELTFTGKRLVEALDAC